MYHYRCYGIYIFRLISNFTNIIIEAVPRYSAKEIPICFVDTPNIDINVFYGKCLNTFGYQCTFVLIEAESINFRGRQFAENN